MDEDRADALPSRILRACGLVYNELYGHAGEPGVVDAELRELADEVLAVVEPMASVPKRIVGCCLFILSQLEGYGLQPSRHTRHADGTEEYVPPLHGPVAGTGPYHEIALHWRSTLETAFGRVTISG